MKSLTVKLGVILIGICLLIYYGYVNAQDSTYWDLVTIGGKCGFKDSKGKIVIKPQFDECYYFFEGLSTVRMKNKWGVIDETGRVVISPKFDDPITFIEGYAIVKVGEKYGYIDRTGKYIIEPKFIEASIFSDGLAKVRDGEKYGYIDITGNYVIEPKFNSASIWFFDGLASVKVGDKWGYIDKYGNYIIEPQFADAFLFSEGFAAVNFGFKWGYINKEGKSVFESRFDKASSFSPDGLASVKVGEKWGFINKKGDVVIDPKFDGPISPNFGPDFYNGMARVKIDGMKASIDVSGQVISSDWKYCCRGSDEATFVYYNKKNMSYPSKNIVRMWSKWVQMGKGYNMQLLDIDCLNKTIKVLNTTSYGRDGKVIYSDSKSPEKSEPDYIVPNSLMEGLSDIVCSQKLK